MAKMKAISHALHKAHGFSRLLRVCRNWPTWLSNYWRDPRDNRPLDFRLRSGLTLHGRKNGIDLHILSEIWLYRGYDRFGCAVRPGEVVVDLGGNIGMFSAYAATVGRAAAVYVFEPHPDNFSLLLRNTEEVNRRLGREVVKPFQMAVWKDGNGISLQTSDNPGGHSAVVPTGSGRSIAVPSLTLESILDVNHVARCDLLKMDIEGAEYDVLESSRHVLPRVGRLVMEHHPTRTRQVGDAVALLREEGFTTTVVNNFLYATRNRFEAGA
jgi:FkbM family methyltransferase